MIVNYAIKTLSPNANTIADELNLNPNSATYRGLTDSRRVGQYLHVVVDDSDNAVLFSKFASLKDIVDSATTVIVRR